MAIPSSYAPHYALELDGKPAGWVADPLPPNLRLSRVDAGAGLGPAGGLRYGDFQASFSLTDSPRLTDWLLGWARKQVTTPAGALLVADVNGHVQRRIEWSRGIPTELRFRALDASSPLPFTASARWQPGEVRYPPVSGGPGAPGATQRKGLLCSNFRVKGFPFEPKALMRIDLPVLAARRGDAVAMPPPGPVTLFDTGDVTLTFGARDRDEVLACVGRVTRDGRLGDDDVFDFGIELLDATFKTVLAQFTLRGCALRGFDETLAASNGDSPGHCVLGFAVAALSLDVLVRAP